MHGACTSKSPYEHAFRLIMSLLLRFLGEAHIQSTQSGKDAAIVTRKLTHLPPSTNAASASGQIPIHPPPQPSPALAP